MKLLIVANYAKEHINKFHLSTIAKFRENGWQVDVACYADAPIEGASHVYSLPCARNPFHPRSLTCIKMLKKLIAENHYDAVHCHTLTGRIIGTLAAKSFRKQGLKLIVTFHGLNYYRGSSPVSKLLIPMDRYLTSFADYVFCNNREDLAFMQSHGYRLAQSSFCPPSVNWEKYRDVATFSAERSATRASLGLRDDQLLLAYVAELTDNKNQTLLLDALSILKKSRPNIRLLLIGPDHMDGRMQQEIERRGLSKQVLCMGWREDVCRLLSACDIYTASSIREGFGVNLLEASVCGLPIVATDNRGHREIVTDGENGFLVPTDEPALLAEKVAALADDAALRNRLTENATRVLRVRFGERVEDTVYRVYQTLFKRE